MLNEVGDENQSGNAFSRQRFLEPFADRSKLTDVPLKVHTPLKMLREDLENIPGFDFPAGYTIRSYRPEDEAHWLRIHLLADKEHQFKPDTFKQQFGSDVRILAQRQFYVLNSAQHVIGTATAWFNEDFDGERIGRVHWVAIVPECQGRGLSRPLMTTVCRRLRELGHNKAYLTTSAARTAAIHLYLRFGFAPLIRTESERAAWVRIVSARNSHLRSPGP
jgi:GNAT superfamily N-acetyltransferase